ncbi:hypothetical protein GCM10012320_23210 [Sinomonas cellulolyticus]|uniref:Serine/threonine protein kinase n=1 Tax=Sinomonas cellulolyticus TaxID=2801916 RepID=A0ABS1K5N8_9MICC|nr:MULTISPECIES: hypothetical protein [Sinomonas]MBL0706853.1 serine/threonine protein kinase [Sinomonas cellulolyticus]GHG52784.1 hypothetical protein GCM10012320_23210 [Sinomonas sp. KCTC 49339]
MDGSASGYWQLHFDENGTATDPGDLVAEIAGSGATDLFVMSHGWDNSEGDAEALYSAMFPLIDSAPGAPAQSRYLGVFWPSIWFPDPPAGATDAALSGAQIASSLARSVPEAAAPLATMGSLIDTGLGHVEAGTATPAEQGAAVEQFHGMLQSVFGGTTASTEDDGESAVIASENPQRDYAALATTMGSAPPAGDAEGLGDIFGPIWNGAKDALRVASFYQMKARAGTVGAKGLGPFLVRLHAAAPALRVHLIGHSFGARLVSFALSGIGAPAQSPVASLTLVQGAFSHWSFTQAADSPFAEAGALCAVADRVAGPLISTFTTADWAVGKWYPRASFLAQQDNEDTAAPNRWGGMGSDGYQSVTPSGDISLPLAPGTALAAGTFYRADANAVIRDTSQSSFAGAHSDIRHPEVAELIVAAATAGAAAQTAQAGAQTAGSQGAGSQAAGTQAR